MLSALWHFSSKFLMRSIACVELVTRDGTLSMVPQKSVS